MARPTKYDEPRAEKICALLRAGCTRKSSAASAGIDFQTFLNWTRRYESFSTNVTRAEADAENIYAAVIQKAATGAIPDWRAAETWLKRRRRDEWGDNVAVSLPNLEEFDDDELDRIAAGEPIERVSASSRSRRARKTATSAEQEEQPDSPPLPA